MTLNASYAPEAREKSAITPPPKPWWRESYLWLVLMGPLCVVLAALWTGYVAMMGSDEHLHLSAPQLSAEQIRHNHMTSNSVRSNEGMLFGKDPIGTKE